MRLDELRGRRVALLGLGTDVRAALPHVVAADPAEVLVVEDDERRVRAAPAELRPVDLAEAARVAEVLVRSPGFPRYRPEVEDALASGVAVTNPTDLWMGTYGGGRRVVAITGTKGKSTTAALVEHLARAVDLDLGVAGNMGVPVFAPEWNDGADTVVVEISSYQAADLHHLPDIAVLTSLAEDHLSWHGGYERYVADKQRVLHQDGTTAGQIIVPEDDGRAMAMTASWTRRVVRTPVADGGRPRHRLRNAALAAAVIEELTGTVIDPDLVVAAADESLPGRLRIVCERDGITWIDDALASNPFAAGAALAWARELGRPTAVLLGGADRGVDPAPLAEQAQRWGDVPLRAVALPDNGARLAADAGIEVVAHADTVADGAERAAEHLRTGGIVLFSPGAPTPPRIGDWQTRSAQFRSSTPCGS